MSFTPERLQELEDTRKEFLASMGLGPRDCVDCGASFTPPPYTECIGMECCSTCASVRFDQFIRTPEGQEALQKARASLTPCQSCKDRSGTGPHTCPFASDVHGDYETMCNCCDECSGNCADDV